MGFRAPHASEILDKMELPSQKYKSSGSQQQRKNHQLTVRFSSSQIQEIEKLSESTGISLAEAARRLVEKGSQQVVAHE